MIAFIHPHPPACSPSSLRLFHCVFTAPSLPTPPYSPLCVRGIATVAVPTPPYPRPRVCDRATYPAPTPSPLRDATTTRPQHSSESLHALLITRMACLQCRRLKKKCINSPGVRACQRCTKGYKICSFSSLIPSSPTPISTTLPPLIPPPTHSITVAKDESHEKNVCLKRSTEFMIASSGDPCTHFNAKHKIITGAQDESREKNVCLKRSTEFTIASCGDPSTHFIAKTILRHSYRLGSRWTPPTNSLKPMPIHFYEPWHIFHSKTNSSLRTLAAHKASSFISSQRSRRAWLNSRKRADAKARKMVN